MVPVLTSSCETLGQSLTHLGASLSAKAEYRQLRQPAGQLSPLLRAGILLHSFVLKDSRIRSPNTPEKHLLHRSSHQVMKTIKNNQAACVLKSPLPGRSRSIPSTFPELCLLPCPRGHTPCSAEPALAWGLRSDLCVKLHWGEDPAHKAGRNLWPWTSGAGLLAGTLQRAVASLPNSIEVGENEKLPLRADAGSWQKEDRVPA